MGNIQFSKMVCRTDYKSALAIYELKEGVLNGLQIRSSYEAFYDDSNELMNMLIAFKRGIK